MPMRLNEEQYETINGYNVYIPVLRHTHTLALSLLMWFICVAKYVCVFFTFPLIHSRCLLFAVCIKSAHCPVVVTLWPCFFDIKKTCKNAYGCPSEVSTLKYRFMNDSADKWLTHKKWWSSGSLNKWNNNSNDKNESQSLAVSINLSDTFEI